MICGLGHIGFRSFELYQQLGMKVAVITDKAPDDWQKKVEASGGVFILGDAQSDELLVRAGVKEAVAILAVTDRDLVNVSVVMDARRLNSEIKIVCRLFDTNLGTHISEAFGVSQIFSTSELAAPVFVGAIHDVGAITQGSVLGQQYALSEALKKGDGQTLAVIGADGDIVSDSIAIPDQKHRLICKPLNATPTVNPPFLKMASNWMFGPALGRVRRIVCIILAIIILSALVVKTEMALSWIDAFYFVTTTVTTVGYGDFNFSSASPGMKGFGILLMLVGTTSLAILFSTVAEAVFSERLSSLFGGRSVPRRGHVVVVGAGNIGLRVVGQLASEQVPVVVIENDKSGRFSADLKRRVAVVEGDAKSIDTLRRANLESAKAILVVSDDDVENLSVGLSAQSLNQSISTIVRVFDADLGEKLQGKISISRILSISGISAPYFVAATLANHVAIAARWRDHLVFLSDSTSHAKDLGQVQMPGLDSNLHLSAMPLSKI